MIRGLVMEDRSVCLAIVQIGDPSKEYDSLRKLTRIFMIMTSPMNIINKLVIFSDNLPLIICTTFYSSGICFFAYILYSIYHEIWTVTISLSCVTLYCKIK